MNLMFGKKAAKFNPYALRMSHYVDKTYVPPPFADHTPFGFNAWGMMMNDTLGDCTIAACGHALQVFTGGKITESDKVIESYYSKWCGYKPGHPNTDNGGVELDVLNDWQAQGFDGHKLIGFVQPQPQNLSHVMHSIAEFGGVYIGFQVPNSAMTQFQNGQVWDVVANDGGIAGGHAVFCPAYHTLDPTYNKETTITCITWGQKQKMTVQFWEKYCDESHTLLAAAWQPTGVDLAGLRADLAFMAG
jgi:hypothetical protein